MQINSSIDILTVLIAIITGSFLSIIYDIFKSFRIAFKSTKLIVFIQDIIYSVLGSNIVFILLLVRVRGELRFFVFFFIFFGFCIFKILISKAMTKLLSKTFILIKNNILFPISLLFKKISFKLNDSIDNIFHKILKNNLKDKV